MDRSKTVATAKSATRRRHANGQPHLEGFSVLYAPGAGRDWPIRTNQTRLSARALQLAWDQSPIPGRHQRTAIRPYLAPLGLDCGPQNNSVTHRWGRGSIRDAPRQGSDRHGRHMILRGDGSNLDVRRDLVGPIASVESRNFTVVTDPEEVAGLVR